MIIINYVMQYYWENQYLFSITFWISLFGGLIFTALGELFITMYLTSGIFLFYKIIIGIRYSGMRLPCKDLVEETFKNKNYGQISNSLDFVFKAQPRSVHKDYEMFFHGTRWDRAKNSNLDILLNDTMNVGPIFRYIEEEETFSGYLKSPSGPFKIIDVRHMQNDKRIYGVKILNRLKRLFFIGFNMPRLYLGKTITGQYFLITEFEFSVIKLKGDSTSA